MMVSSEGSGTKIDESMRKPVHAMTRSYASWTTLSRRAYANVIR